MARGEVPTPLGSLAPTAARPQHLTLRELDVWVGGKDVLSSSKQTQKASPPYRTA